MFKMEYDPFDSEENEEREEAMEPRRMEVYSDAVFSIIATINILPAIESLKEVSSTDTSGIASVGVEEPLTAEDIIGIWAASAVVFMVISVQLRYHNMVFENVPKITVVFTVLNTLYFMVLALIPFGNGLLLTAEDITAGRGSWLAPMIHASIIFGASFIQWIMTLWMWRCNPLKRMPYEVMQYASWNLLFIGIACMLVVIIGIFYPAIALSAYVFPLIFWLIKRKIEVVVRKMAKKRRGEGGDSITSSSRSVSLYSETDPTEMGYMDHSVKSYNTSLPRPPENFELDTRTGLLRKISFAKERLEAFSDGIFAIAITLVAVNLRAPTAEQVIDDGTLFAALSKLWSQYVGHVATFALAGLQWYFHSKIVSAVAEVDISLFTINNSYLFTVASLPLFVETGTTFFSSSSEEYAELYFSMNLIVMGVMQAWMWFTVHHSKKRRIESSMLLHRFPMIFLYLGICITPISGIVMFSLAFFNVDAAIVGLLISLPVLTIILIVITARYYAVKKKAADHSRGDQNNHAVWSDPDLRLSERGSLLASNE